jgi:hypothetical protein
VKGPRIIVKVAGPLGVVVPYTERAPIIDGEFAGEPAWKGAAKLGQFKHTMSGKPALRATDVHLMWDDENLYVAMRAEDDYLMSQYQEHDDELWHEDAFEIFLDTKGDGKRYYELQVNPAGVVFDSFLPSYRKNQNEWTSQMVVQVQREGELNEENGHDTGWTAEMAIPFSALYEEDGVPPKPGDRWRVNFFRVDKTEKKNRYSAWSPPLRGDFHALDKFGQMAFVKLSSSEQEKKTGAKMADDKPAEVNQSQEKGEPAK